MYGQRQSQSVTRHETVTDMSCMDSQRERVTDMLVTVRDRTETATHMS